MIEAEHVACYSATCQTSYSATCQTIWLQNFILRLCVVITILRPLKIFYDNFVAIAFSQNVMSFSCFNYIDIRYLFVREKIVESYICVKHISIEHMLVESQNKSLTPKMLQKHVTHLRLLESSITFNQWKFYNY